MATVFQQLTEGTGDLADWSSTSGTVTVDTTNVSQTATRAIKCDSTASNLKALAVKTTSGVSAQGRCSFYFRADTNLPSADARIFALATGVGGVVSISLLTTGQLRLTISSETVTSASSLSVDTQYRICLAYTRASSAVYEVRVFVNGSQVITKTDSGGSGLWSSTIDRFSVGWGDISSGSFVPGASRVCHFHNVYYDDSSALTDTGNICLTNKFPAAVNTNSFDTTIGTGTNRWDYVDERPVSETNGLQHAASSDVQENFTLQTAAQGDVDISAGTLIARTAWLWAKRGSNGTAVAIATTVTHTSNNPTTTATTTAFSPAVNDVMIAAVTSRDSTGAGTLAVSDSVEGAWTKFANSTDHKATLWWKRAGSTTSRTVTVANAVGSVAMRVTTFSGCITSGNAYADVIVDPNASGNEVQTGITPTNASSMVLATVHNYNNDNTITSPSLANVGGTMSFDERTSTGGSDCAVALCYEVTMQTAATGDFTWTQATDGVTYSILFTLVPQDPVIDVGLPDLMDNGTEKEMTLATTSAVYTNLTDSASYPSNAAGIGIRSSGTAVDTYLYECGTVIAYTPGAVVVTMPSRLAIIQTAVHRSFNW
jgi:hypothetical protein